MRASSTVHPTKFEINGMFFQVVSYAPLSDQQAERVARHFHKTHKFKKKDKGKLFTIETTIDENSANMW